MRLKTTIEKTQPVKYNLYYNLKKVLIITYYWPPSGGGGVQRWVKFVKYLRTFGWEPTVFTPENPEIPAYDESLMADVPKDVKIVRNRIWEPYQYYKKLTGRKKTDKIQTAFLNEKNYSSGVFERLSIWIRGNFFIPDARRYWIKPSVRLLEKYINENDFEAIVSTGPPHSAHMIGLQLKQKTGIPWLADFRDPWTNIDYYKDLKLGKRADRIHHRLEKQILEEADAITVISPGMASEFNAIVKKDYKVIPNGYDAEDIIRNQENNLVNNKFSLAHIGSLTKTRNPNNLWEALKQLVDNDKPFAKDLEIHNIGKIDISAVESIKSYKLDSFLKQTDYLPHEKVIIEQQKATLLLLLVNNTPNAKLILTGKIFEYLVSGTPIICIAPHDGDAAAVINETSCGTSYDFDETDKLKTDIYNYYQQFKKGNIISECRNIEKYDRKNLTRKLGEILDELCSSNQNP